MRCHVCVIPWISQNYRSVGGPHPRLVATGKCSVRRWPMAWNARWMGSWDGLVVVAADDSQWVVGECLPVAYSCCLAVRSVLLFTADLRRASRVDMFDLAANADVVNCTGNSYTSMTSRSIPTAKTFVEVHSDSDQRGHFASDDLHTVDRTRPTVCCIQY